MQLFVLRLINWKIQLFSVDDCSVVSMNCVDWFVHCLVSNSFLNFSSLMFTFSAKFNTSVYQLLIFFVDSPALNYSVLPLSIPLNHSFLFHFIWVVLSLFFISSLSVLCLSSSFFSFVSFDFVFSSSIFQVFSFSFLAI